MPFLLNTQNVLKYLEDCELLNLNSEPLLNIQPKSGKNFNLLVKFQNKAAFLVKQERFDLQGRTDEEFKSEWRLQQLLNTFSELEALREWIVEAIHIDLDRSILVFDYLQTFVDLSDFYADDRFPTAIATQLGQVLAQIHRATFNQSQISAFLLNQGQSVSPVPKVLYGLERIGVSVFQQVRQDSLEFYRKYQRFESLGSAIAQVQPSLSALRAAYFEQFPEILSINANCLTRSIQFAGAVLIESIQIKLEYHDEFNNRDVCKLQVAKTLLCQPEQAI